jgi:FAD/FMN-containing dehydrogenase
MKYIALTTALLSFGLAQDDILALEADNAGLQCLDARVVPHKRPSHAEYAKLVEPFNSRLPYKPAVVVLPTSNQHVQDAVLCAAQTDMKVQARCGGHGYASYSSGGKDGHMILNLRYLQTIQLDNSSGVATVGGGVRLGNLASSLWDQGKAVLSHVSTLCDCARAES